MLIVNNEISILVSGVMLTNENLISNICQNVYAKGLDFIDFPTARTQPRTVCVLPMFHVFGLLVTSLMTIHVGGKIVTISKFDPKIFVKSIKTHKPTFLHLAPPLVSFLANSQDVTEDDFKCLKHVQVRVYRRQKNVTRLLDNFYNPM